LHKVSSIDPIVESKFLRFTIGDLNFEILGHANLISEYNQYKVLLINFVIQLYLNPWFVFRRGFKKIISFKGSRLELNFDPNRVFLKRTETQAH
jgi:hypothetical protein